MKLKWPPHKVRDFPVHNTRTKLVTQLIFLKLGRTSKLCFMARISCVLSFNPLLSPFESYDSCGQQCTVQLGANRLYSFFRGHFTVLLGVFAEWIRFCRVCCSLLLRQTSARSLCLCTLRQLLNARWRCEREFITSYILLDENSWENYLISILSRFYGFSIKILSCTHILSMLQLQAK